MRADPATEGADLAHVMWIQPRVAAAAMDGPTKERARGRKVEEEVDWSPASAFPAAARASDGCLGGSETGNGAGMAVALGRDSARAAPRGATRGRTLTLKFSYTMMFVALKS